MRGVTARERYLAARVLNALIREDYGGITDRIVHDKDGIALLLASGRAVRLSSGFPFQDFAVPVPPPGGAEDAAYDAGVGVSLAEVLETLAAVADPADAPGVAAFARECHETLAALELHHRYRAPRRDQRRGLIFYETLAAGVDHPIYPTARCRLGVPAEDLIKYAPEFAPVFPLSWAAVPRERVTATVDPAARLPWWPHPANVGLPGEISRTHVLFPVHPLTVPTLTAQAEEDPRIVLAPTPYLTVRPTLSMRTVEVGERVHLKLPLPTSTLGLRNRRSIKPGTLRDGALAESLLREVLVREPRLRVSLADEQVYGHAGDEYLAWLVRGLPGGEIVPVAALLAELPRADGPSATRRQPARLVLHAVADRYHRGDVVALLRDYLTVLFEWNVTLFVRYGIALEAHQQNLSLLLGGGPMRLLIKDNDGLLVSPDLLRAAGPAVPDFGDDRMFTDNPHALADVFVTITLHLAAMAVAHGALPHAAAGLLREVLSAVLDEFGDSPMAALLRARTLDAERLTAKSMLTAGTLVAKERTGARDINKYYGTTGPNYLRPRTAPTGDGGAPSREADAQVPEKL